MAARATAAQIRAAMFGDETSGAVVVRQARRLHEGDSDEIALLEAGGAWWVARRTSAAVSVYAYIGDDEAEAGFERLSVAAEQGREQWAEAERVLLRREDDG